MGQLNDISLVAQVVVFKNTRAFDTLVKKYQSPVRRFFLHQTLGDGELSDDLAQETFLKAYTNLSSFKNLSSFSTWLYRIAYNVFYDYIRGTGRAGNRCLLPSGTNQGKRANGHISGIEPTERGRANMHHSVLYGGPADRKNSDSNRYACRNCQIPPLAWKRKTF